MSTMVETAISPRHRYADGHKKKAPRPRHAGANNLFRRICGDHWNWDDMKRLGAIPDFATVVGRLYLFGVLTELEATAARRYAEIVGRHDRYHGISRRQMASPAYDRGYGREDEVARREANGTIAAYERRAKRARREWDRFQKVIPNSLARSALDDVCVNNREIPTAQHDDLKTLLARMAKLYGGREQAERPTRSPMLKIVDTVLAQVVIYFSGEKAQIKAFRVRTDIKDHVGITCYGPGPTGELAQTAVVKTGKILPEAFAAAFLKAAERAGWEERQ
jgi:hypothetical protein